MPSINPIENYNFGVFGLNDTRTSIITSTPTAVGIETGTDIASIVDIGNWSQESTHGWFIGGVGGFSRVDRIDFSNDSSTLSTRGPLSSGRGYLAATGNSNYGWFGGGFVPGPIALSTVDRIDFSNDSSTASVRGPLSLTKYKSAATGNSNYGWFGGGYIPTIPQGRSTVDRIDFSNDSSTASIRGPLSAIRYSHAATGNSNYGWFGGGINLSSLNRIDFSNDSATASVRGLLSLPTSSMAATGNSNYGWFGGGISGLNLSIVDRIDFSNDSSRVSVRGPLSFARANLGATGNSNYGWFSGGYNPGVTTVDRIDFSNDSGTSSVRGPLSFGRFGLNGISGQAKSSSIRPLKGGNFGWWGGGGAGSFGSGATNTVDRIDFSNDSTTASLRGPLSLARFRLSAVANSNYGWFGGGDIGVVPGNRTTVDRIDFSNDSIPSLVRGSLLFTCERFRGTGNSNYGWFALDNQTQRIDFSNDSSQGSSRGQLNASRYGSTLLGNSGYGWVVGGRRIAPNINYTLVERINFSNDSSLASIRGPLNQSTLFQTSTANSNYGWVGGGIFLSPTPIQRMDFSNDSATSIIRGPVSLPRSDISASGNANYGWFVGGTNANPSAPAYYSIVDRIDFSNDSTTSSTRGPLSAAKGYATGACSNTPIG